MALLIIAIVLAAQSSVLQTEIMLAPGGRWSENYIFAPGDSIFLQSEYRREIGSSLGCLGGVGDVLYYKGDNVGKLVLREWEGKELSSVWRQTSSNIVYYTEEGGAYSVTVENHSGHRSNLYSLSITRTPTRSDYRDFRVAFVSDTTHDTTWVDEPVYETVYDTTLVKREWIETFVDEKPLGLTSGSRTLYRGIIGSNKSEVTFDLPSNSTGDVALALFSDLERLGQLQREAKQKTEAVTKLASWVPEYGVTFALLFGALGPVFSSGDGAFNYGLVDLANPVSYYGGTASANYCKSGTGVTNELLKIKLAAGHHYVLVLSNPSFLDKAVVGYEISTVTRDLKFIPRYEMVPKVTGRPVQVGTRKVPQISKTVTARVPWRPRGR